MTQTDTLAQIRAIAMSHAQAEGPLLPLLHAVQDRFGHIPAEALPEIAQVLNISDAELRGVISFYHDFRDAPPGRRILRLCRAEACQAMGAPALIERILAHLGLERPGTTDDGALTVEFAYCLGLCACAPAALLDGLPLGRLTDAALRTALEEPQC
ncbi:formate dehydrogenase gamma subunit [Rhodovulum imhoffii]|uniref:Formate dehydrogenase gamma subunit n=1 Tax=Rhodovulum imhoffii TaxID=365340 RepID=A0A2T5BWQ2_9RHOB|nr:formate dehydrogenase subunit gamma [Rhodovulum imhoffii]MBK5932483.1 formate dehydrogenase subunit gamma [Rhodovulum imhoffii]PTN04038.1 formate dehydrogenase gamma subunit [Rhodovulum imhoffii]